ncbi:hypothetical protein [Sinomonas humi]|uniref:PRC-barrel domain-containing protein n=1 Tax=Sinomonas humi TaxID=1338436 RepID=A0A0B2AHS2_9MICC|nr:hypothetical protein [Sinomonas humi]KHL01428.1 hypothetical protein LK10_16350 [Sinomonas humi]
MMLTYSRLRGLAVSSDDGQPRGRVLDLIVAPDGEDMVVRALLVVPHRFALLAGRFKPRPKTTTIPASHIAAIDENGIRLRGNDG